LIIAILTYDNPNVFYELALCHVARKPFIQMIEKEKKIPFDTSHVRTIQYGLDVKSAEETKDRLKNLLQRNLDGNIENPISLGLDALKLKESNAPIQQVTAGIFEILQTLDNRLRIIQNQMIRQASDNPFNPTHELFSYDEGREKSKKLALHIINTFRHAYNIEGNVDKEKKEKEEI
jgi:hypothetical protein